MTLNQMNRLAAYQAGVDYITDRIPDQQVLKIASKCITTFPYMRDFCASCYGSDPEKLSQDFIRTYVLNDHIFDVIDVSRMMMALKAVYEEREDGR